MNLDYIREPKLIYDKSFAIIRMETDLSKFPEDIAEIVVRLIHACGMTDIVDDIIYSPDVLISASDALKLGAPILCDVSMVTEGIIKSLLPANNQVLCWNRHPECRPLAHKMRTTLSAASVEFWRPHLAGSVVAIGNAPTTLFRLLEILANGADPPAVIFGFPVGFVGAVESKELLVNQCRKNIPFMTLSKRRGGSAMASAVVNAIAKRSLV